MRFFFFNDTATTEIYTLSLHDALPICGQPRDAALRGGPGDHLAGSQPGAGEGGGGRGRGAGGRDRKSTRLNSSHLVISYAVFCLKKKNSAPDVMVSCPQVPNDNTDDVG